MKILWINTATTKTISNTRLYGMPPQFIKWGDETHVLIGGRADGKLPEYFHTIPLPFGRLRLYRLLLTILLPVFLWRYRYDVVISDWLTAKMTRLGILLRRLGIIRCQFVHDVRTVPVKEDQGKSYYHYAGSLNYAKRYFDGLTTITEPLREKICSEFSFPSDQIAVWTSGVDIDHFHPLIESELRRELGLDGEFVVFYHGSIHENRGVVELAEAFDFLRDLEEIRLLIVGGGNQWERLESTVKQKKLDQVILKPSVPYREIPRWIALADLCAVPLPDHPWWQVSSPLKLMEYLAMGKPILLTDMAAHRTVIPNDENVFYVSGAVPEIFAEGIRRAFHQRERFAELGKWGRQYAVSELTWEKQAKILKEYLQQVMFKKINLRRKIG